LSISRAIAGNWDCGLPEHSRRHFYTTSSQGERRFFKKLELRAVRPRSGKGWFPRIPLSLCAIGLAQAVGILSAAGTQAAQTLRTLLTSQADQIRLSAARTILETAAKLREAGRFAKGNRGGPGSTHQLGTI
jgi:hypothetical protein